ncbi:MAG: hypothetical protein JJE10_04325 [Thermoleophilia bacterium]|nr:hypothetical protein [Thermoleophilia bacterium]
MKQIFGVIVVAVVAVINMYVAIPLGYGFDLSANVIAVAAFVGSVGGTVAMVFVGDRIMPAVRRLYRRIRPKDDEADEQDDSGEEKSGKARGLVDRFGAPGLGIIGPMTIGGFASVISGVAMGIPKVKLAIWIGIGQAIVVILYSLMLDQVVAA